MTRVLIVVLLAGGAAVALLSERNRRLSSEVERLRVNVRVLSDSTRFYRTSAGRSAASVEQLSLSLSELRERYADVVRTAREADVAPRRIAAAATVATVTRVAVEACGEDSDVCGGDSISGSPTGVDAGAGDSHSAALRFISPTPRSLTAAVEYHDAWVDVVGEGARVEIAVRDTLRQVVHRVPRRIWFIRWGTKAIRQEIVSSNPHTRVVFSEYIVVR